MLHSHSLVIDAECGYNSLFLAMSRGVKWNAGFMEVVIMVRWCI